MICECNGPVTGMTGPLHHLSGKQDSVTEKRMCMKVNHNVVICRNYRGNVKKEGEISTYKGIQFLKDSEALRFMKSNAGQLKITIDDEGAGFKL